MLSTVVSLPFCPNGHANHVEVLRRLLFVFFFPSLPDGAFGHFRGMIKVFRAERLGMFTMTFGEFWLHLHED